MLLMFVDVALFNDFAQSRRASFLICFAGAQENVPKRRHIGRAKKYGVYGGASRGSEEAMTRDTAMVTNDKTIGSPEHIEGSPISGPESQYNDEIARHTPAERPPPGSISPVQNP